MKTKIMILCLMISLLLIGMIIVSITKNTNELKKTPQENEPNCETLLKIPQENLVGPRMEDGRFFSKCGEVDK